MTSASSYVMIAGIDFGTTYSGYACSFRNAKDEIRMNKNWGQSLGFQSNQTPTTVLTDKKGDFLAFGYEAEQQFTQVDDDDDDDENSEGFRKNVYRHFKMILHKQEKLTMKTVVFSTTGQITPAIEIFTHALRYLKEHLLEELGKQLTSAPKPSMIQWVITVPAIWSDESKQFMREAAFRAGCISLKDSTQLVIALEPEAASFYCRQLKLAQFDDSGDVTFPSGTRYLVLDLGGGTNDMVVHEVVLDYNVKELYTPSGGAHGGMQVDDKFVLLLQDILGKQFIESYKDECPKEWFSFTTRFERAKKATKIDGITKMNIEIPWSMAEQYTVMNPGKNIRKVLEGMKSKGITCRNGCIVLSNEVIQSLFSETIAGIIYGVKQVLKQLNSQHLDYIFMVGGFSESHLIQDEIKKEFGGNGCKVLVPSEAQLAIIKGAVLFGHYQNQIVSRVARRTYGCGGSFPFIEGVHAESKKYVDSDGKAWCLFIFKPLVEKDEEIEIGSTRRTVYNLESARTELSIALYSIERKPQQPVEYTDHADVTTLGEITIQTPDLNSGADRNVVLRLTFGNTEILAEAIDQTTGNKATALINFLSE